MRDDYNRASPGDVLTPTMLFSYHQVEVVLLAGNIGGDFILVDWWFESNLTIFISQNFTARCHHYCVANHRFPVSNR